MIAAEQADRRARQGGPWSALAGLWAGLRGRRRPGAPGLGSQVAAFPRMVQAVLAGRYRAIAKTRLLMMAGALLYVVSPFDVMPEALLILLGLGDDAFVLTWLAGAMLAETENFLDWEAAQEVTSSAQQPVVRTEVV